MDSAALVRRFPLDCCEDRVQSYPDADILANTVSVPKPERHAFAVQYEEPVVDAHRFTVKVPDHVE